MNLTHLDHKKMFSREDLETIWATASKVRKEYPSTYVNLTGIKRLAILRLLDEPVQSTLHQIIQQNVREDTPCPCKGCAGVLDLHGRCSKDCSQLGINTVDDIIHCRNCDCYGFPCGTCHEYVFHKQIRMCQGDY